MSGRLDIVLFGATGFTGRYCIRWLFHLTRAVENEYQKPLTWGVAGRSETKLKEALAYCQEKLGTNANLKYMPIIIADVGSYDSLKHMTACARIIINCCGPYQMYGEPVIKACIETGTHHIDVSGEPGYMESMQLKYHSLAEKKGVYIIQACGFDSIVADLGVLFLQQNFNGVLNSVECFTEKTSELKNAPYSLFNFATWESAIHGFSTRNNLKDVRSKLFKEKLPRFLPKLKARSPNTKCEFIDGHYGVVAPTSDRSVVFRTQRHLFETKNMRPVQFEYYTTVKSRYALFLLAFYGAVFQFLVDHGIGRKILLKYPELFSNGYVTRAENLSEEALDKTKIIMKMVGSGWDSDAPKAENDAHNFQDLPDQNIYCTIKGYNPTYGIASAGAVISAIMVLLEADKLPSRGGVYTPGAAFIDTSIIEQLQKHEILDFKIKSKL